MDVLEFTFPASKKYFFLGLNFLVLWRKEITSYYWKKRVDLINSRIFCESTSIISLYRSPLSSANSVSYQKTTQSFFGKPYNATRVVSSSCLCVWWQSLITLFWAWLLPWCQFSLFCPIYYKSFFRRGKIFRYFFDGMV